MSPAPRRRLPCVEPVVVDVAAPLGPADAERLLGRVASLLGHDGRPVVVLRTGQVDLSVVDLLARVELLARRSGGVVRVLAVGAGLDDLLALAGLQDAVPPRLQPVGQAEPGEQPGVEEVVHVHELPA